MICVVWLLAWYRLWFYFIWMGFCFWLYLYDTPKDLTVCYLLLLQVSSVFILSRSRMALRLSWSSWRVQWRTREVGSFYISCVQMLPGLHRHQSSCCTQYRAWIPCRHSSICAGLSLPAEYGAITSTFFRRRHRWRSTWSRLSTMPWHDNCIYPCVVCYYVQQ